ncbi:hypothetical protein AB2L57_10825 [Microbacterium sp. HA-8]|uniref:hypothetical protein n=1 Tax=Microbacterium sp. HA-8 TaxID=3234200 RepID=UPI0038F5E491
MTMVSAPWLPAHHERALYTAAHIDGCIARLSAITHDYLAADPLQLASTYSDGMEHLVLTGVDPLPEAVPRLFADALNNARNLIEHALYAEVGDRLSRELTDLESKAVEIPATSSPESFETWTRHKNRKSTGLFVAGGELASRIERLQPYHRQDHTVHPLKLLVEYTNASKHREPVVSVVRLGRVDVDGQPRDPRASTHQDITEIGSVIISVPMGTQVGVNLWPQIMVRRPHTGELRTLMHELGDIEEWVRAQALPILIAGRTDLPELPPALDISVGYESTSAAWGNAGTVPARTRATLRMMGAGLRRDMLEMLVDQNGEHTRDLFVTWMDTFTEEEVVAMFVPLGLASATNDLATVTSTLQAWADAAGVVPER